MDLLLADHDIDITNGELAFVEGIAAVAQHVVMRLRTWVGEAATKYDKRAGVPYLEIMFGVKNPNIAAIQSIVDRKVLETPGVLSAQTQVTFDRAAHTLTMSGQIRTADGVYPFTTEIAP